MAVSVETVINNVARTLLDTAFRTWSRAEHVANLNIAQRLICGDYKLDAYPKRDFVTLVAGIAQDLPADGTALIDITDNEVSGRAVTQTDLAILQEENRFWPAATQQTEVENYAADPRTPRKFYVFPPNDGTGSVRVTYGAIPAELTGSSGENIALSDAYQYPIERIMLSMAFAKNSVRQDLSKSQAFINEARLALGLKSQGQVAVAPKTSQSPGVA